MREPTCPKCDVIWTDTGYYEDGQRCHDPRPPVSGEPRCTLDDLIWAARAWGQEEASHFALPSTLEAYRKEVEDIRAAIEAEASTGATLDAHEAEYVDDGGDGYLACRCGYGYVVGEDDLIDHIHDARLAEQSDV